MNIYYVPNKRSESLNMSEFVIGSKKIDEIRKEIKARLDFCREETSIERSDLIGYLGSGFTIYLLDETSNLLSAVLNFDINTNIDGQYITIYGICVPPPSTGLGSKLINAVKNFARSNGIKQIKLTCYSEETLRFYIKNEFRLVGSRVLDDSDDEGDSDDEDKKVKYDMLYVGGRRIGTRKRIIKRKRIGTRKRIGKRKRIGAGKKNW